MNIIITGATGFIGKNLYSDLKKNKKYNLFRILRKKNICTKNDLYYEGNINNLIEYFDKIKPKVVIHLATYYVSQHKYTDINDLVQSNELFTNQILEAMKISGTKDIIYTTTRWQNYYSRNSFPLNLYATHKENCLNLIKFYKNHYKMNYIDLRLSDTIGKNDHRKKIFYFIKNYKKKEPFPMTKGDQLIYLTHIEDIISSIKISLNYLINGKYINKTYSVFPEKPVRLKSLVKKYVSLNNFKIKIDWGSLPQKKFEILQDNKIYPRLYGWRPKINLSKALKNIK